MSTRVRVAMIVVLCVFTTTSCQALAFIGDSVTGLSAGAFHARFDARYTVTVDSENGATIDDMAAVADRVAATHPWAAVINLGTNDSTAQNPDIVSDYDVLASKFPASTCLAAVTVSTSRGSSSFDEFANRLNAHIRWDAWFHRWRLVDWDDALVKYFALGDPYGPMLTNQVHPTDMGQRWLAQQVDEALSGCPA